MLQPIETGIGSVADVDNKPTYADYSKTFFIEANNPPGQDKCLGAFYSSLHTLSQNDTSVSTFIREIVSARQLPPQYFTNLFFRSVQFIELFKKRNSSYPSAYDTADKWSQEIQDLINNDQALLADCLLTKDTATTIYQRYAGPKAILNLLLPDKALKIADFGCGGNYGLRGISIDEPFEDVNELAIQELIRQPTFIEEGMAIDKYDPDDPNVKAWRIACSFYPKELTEDKIKAVLDFEDRIAKNSRTVKFLKEDLTLPSHLSSQNHTIPSQYFDAVIISTICYQLPQEKQGTILDKAKDSLKPTSGILIIQDFALKDPANPKTLKFPQNWFIGQFPYRTFVSASFTNWQIKEMLQWRDGRCRYVQQGEDFREYLLS